MLLLFSADLQTAWTKTGLPNKMSDQVWIHLLFDTLMVSKKKVDFEKKSDESIKTCVDTFKPQHLSSADYLCKQFGPRSGPT